MSTFLEPVYLNESMMLNCAAYLFEGVTNEIEVSKASSQDKKGALSLGSQFLKELIGLSGNIEISNQSTKQEKLAKKYTTGGLHMTVIDELRTREDLVTISDLNNLKSNKSYVEFECVLKPVDFYSIIETLKVVTPLIIKILHDFGEKINPKIFSKNMKSELVKYDDIIKNILDSFEKDYLKSSLLEMIMVNPNNEIQFGILDIDVKDKDATEIKSKLTDGKFYVIGKVTKSIPKNGKIELLRRSFLSTIMGKIPGLLLVSKENDSLTQFQNWISVATPTIEKICQLTIKGPAVRMMAMSVCI